MRERDGDISAEEGSSAVVDIISNAKKRALMDTSRPSVYRATNSMMDRRSPGNEFYLIVYTMKMDKLHCNLETISIPTHPKSD